MEWFKGKIPRGAPTRQERPGSQGSNRDPRDVSLEGIADAGAATSAGSRSETGDAVPDGEERQNLQTSVEHVEGKAEVAIPDGDKASDDGFRAVGKEISRQELAERLFDTIDTSRDGTVCKDELSTSLQAIGYKRVRAELIFDSIDEDGSNEISKDEFVAFFLSGQNEELFRKLRYAGIKTKIPKNVPVLKTGCAGPARASVSALALQEVWEQHDADRDGWLTEEQLYTALRSAGIRLRKKEKHELRRELEDELELWSDSNETVTPSDASVASDADAEETVYEDHTHVVRVLQNNPKDSIERLVVDEMGKPQWTAVLEGEDRLDRDKPEYIANWVAATCTPGLCLKETKEEIMARSKFFRTVHRYQMDHETNALSKARLSFQSAWSDRELQKSDAEIVFRKWLKKISTLSYWKGLVLHTILRIQKRVEDELVHKQDLLTRSRIGSQMGLRRSSIVIKPRPMLERVDRTFIEELGHLTEYGRQQKYETAFEDVSKREETANLGVRGVIRALRAFGASLNSAEVFEMFENLTGMDTIAEDVVVDIENFSILSEMLFTEVNIAAGKDKVIVFIQEASDLPMMDRFGSADPFVTVEVLGRPDEDRRRTATRKQSLNPAWNHEMSVFDVKQDDVLLVSMWDDEDSGFGATLIGEFTVSLADVGEIGTRVNNTTDAIERWFELIDDHGKVIVGKFGGATKLRAKVSYVRGSLTELRQKPIGPQNIEFSLITIKIKSAEHLPKMDKGDNGSVDPYCVLTYLDNKIRTNTCVQNYSPVWDEEYVLSVDVPEGEIVVTMYDYDDEGKDDPIGSCKVFVSLLDGYAQEVAYDLRSVEENSLIIGKDGERAKLCIEASIVRNEDMQENMSLLEIMFEGMACDNHATVLACCSAMWQVVQHDEDRCEREALHILNQWQTMADILLSGVLEINVYGATDLPRMDYFGLCDPYVTVSLDGFEAKTEVRKTSLDPVWDETVRVPTWLVPRKPSAPASEKPTILVRIYDWDKVGEHDLVGSVLIPLEDWITRGPETAEWEVLGEPEKVRSLRPGEPDQIVRKPVIGHSGRPSKLQMTIDYMRRKVVMDECMEEICWSIAFGCMDHQQNAESFGLTLGGVGGLTSLLRKPLIEGTTGEALQAACYALGILAEAHRPNQKIILANQGIDRLLDLCTCNMPSGVQRSACLALAAVVGDEPVCMARMLNYHKNDPEEDELVQRAGGIGKLLVLLRDVRPDPNFKVKKGGDQDGWGVVAQVYEACIKAIAAASFVDTRGLWFTNATSFFSKADQRATVRKVAVALGRPGLLVIRDLSLLPVDNKENREHGARRATKETLRYANLSYQALDAAYGSG